MKKLIIALMLLSGCAASRPTGPPEVHYGEDECSRCRMIVGEPRYCAATRLGEETRVFDDLGELFEQPLRPGEEAWVHDDGTAAWIDARTACYVSCPGVRTPMGYGFLACKDAAEAAVLAARYHGKVLTFAEMSSR